MTFIISYNVLLHFFARAGTIDFIMLAIKLLILFGSQASGATHARSDVDVAVLGDRPLTEDEKESVRERAAKQFHVSEEAVDAVDLWSASPLLAQEIAARGKLLHGTQADFLRFRVLAWKRYQDTAKFRRAREEALKHSLHVS